MKKNKSNEYTKDLQVKLWVLRVIDWICLLAPVIIFFFIGLCSPDGLVYQKIALVGTFLIAAMIGIFNIIAKKHIRSVIWIMIIGLYIAVDNILPLIICVAVATILDDFVFTPAVEHYRIKYISSKTDDQKREFYRKKNKNK